MELKIEQLRCGGCGESKHYLFIRPNGEVIAECPKCSSQSEIVMSEPKIVIKNNSGSGTLCVFENEKS